MARRVFSFILALVLCAMLCGIHACEGEECRICALARDLRRDSLIALCICVIFSLSLISLFLRKERQNINSHIFTLVEAKVELTD